MKLTALASAPVFHVICRAHDLQEIYTLQGHKDPYALTAQVMRQANFSWLAWANEEPVAVFGGSPVFAGVWQMFLMATPNFPRVTLGLTRFARREVVPRLFGEIGAHRLQCDLHAKHEFVHRWVEGFGAVREGVLKGLAADGSDYFRYVLSKDVDRETRQD